MIKPEYINTPRAYTHTNTRLGVCDRVPTLNFDLFVDLFFMVPTVSFVV